MCYYSVYNEKVIVWCDTGMMGVIGPHFFETADRQHSAFGTLFTNCERCYHSWAAKPPMSTGRNFVLTGWCYRTSVLFQHGHAEWNLLFRSHHFAFCLASKLTRLDCYIYLPRGLFKDNVYKVEWKMLKYQKEESKKKLWT